MRCAVTISRCFIDHLRSAREARFRLVEANSMSETFGALCVNFPASSHVTHGSRCDDAVMTARRLLIVDDEDNLRSMLAAGTRARGCSCRPGRAGTIAGLRRRIPGGSNRWQCHRVRLGRFALARSSASKRSRYGEPARFLRHIARLGNPAGRDLVGRSGPSGSSRS